MEYRFSESIFRKFEVVLTQAVANLPGTTTFNPAPYTPTTFSRRLRDAKRSLQMYNWATRVDKAKLAEFELVIAERERVVLTGTVDSLRAVETIPIEPTLDNSRKAGHHLVLTTDLPDVINAALTLLNYGAIHSLTLPPSVDIESKQNQFDFIFERKPNMILVL